jgi:hypothetical protein
MDPSLNDLPAPSHVLLPDTRPRMAKAVIRKADTAWRAHVGLVIQRVRSLAGLSLKEFAAVVDRDERQCARWENSTERPQFDAVFAVASLRQLLVQAFAEIAGAEVEITVRIKRSA